MKWLANGRMNNINVVFAKIEMTFGDETKQTHTHARTHTNNNEKILNYLSETHDFNGKIIMRTSIYF